MLTQSEIRTIEKKINSLPEKQRAKYKNKGYAIYAYILDYQGERAFNEATSHYEFEIGSQYGENWRTK